MGVVKYPTGESVDDDNPPADDSWEPTDEDDPRAPPKSTQAPATLSKKTIELRPLGDRLRAALGSGPPSPTGIEPLDVHLRGGLRAEKLMVIGGAPGSGKTTLAAQFGRALARQGVAVAFLAIDEEPAGIDARNLESIGIARDHAEAPELVDIEKAEAELGGLPFELLDDCTLEDAFEALAKKYPDSPRCVIGDSIQRLQTRQTLDIDSIRERISDVVATAKRCARDPKTRAMVILTSELSRGAYRSKKAEEQIDDLAAFKESGAVEYAMTVGLVLRTSSGDASLVRVTMPKNRTGTRGSFALRLDFERATFTPEDAPEDAGDSERLADFDKLCDRVLEAVKANPGASSRRIRTEVGAKRDGVYSALEKLETHGAIRNTAKGGRAAKWAPVLKPVESVEEG
ncbi:MAG TPA: RAD55 family ATPase [Polyangiaceae bacterium]|jgi:RecA/RadA recombinase|nr:RAD55 family ATPase [Polyangiaceae bacterium]